MEKRSAIVADYAHDDSAVKDKDARARAIAGF
jgi:hypothetical protein